MFAQGLQHLHGARNRLRVRGNLLDLHRHEALINRVDVLVGRATPERLDPSRLNAGFGKQRADVVALGQAHGAARLFKRDRHAKGGERIDEDLRGRQGTEVHQGAGPIKNDCFDLGKLFAREGGSLIHV
ncbi:hypothetical protein D3C87_1778330 [compost metagenome]